jgi:hypothetical protein
MNHTNFIKKKFKHTQYNKKIIIISKRLNKPKKSQRMVINQNINEKIYFLKIHIKISNLQKK